VLLDSTRCGEILLAERVHQLDGKTALFAFYYNTHFVSCFSPVLTFAHDSFDHTCNTNKEEMRILSLRVSKYQKGVE
jgi:hypothetical protein